MANSGSNEPDGFLKRRAFLSTAALAAGGCGAPGPAPGYRALSAEEAATLETWCEALIPADQDAGAGEARVTRFIDTQLTRKYKKKLPAYRTALDAFARWRVAHPGAAVETLLTAMEKGEAPREYFPDGGRAAFEMVLAHAMQGFYGSPRHGGNRDYVSWKMLGVPRSPVRGRQHYSIREGKS